VNDRVKMTVRWKPLVRGPENQCCSQGQNPKAKDEAKARALETKIKARTLESKTNFKAKYDSQFNANIPHAIDMTIAPIS